jgi:toluene monooxygenase system protein B
MALTPIVIMIRGDFLYHLLPLDSELTMAKVAEMAADIGLGRVEPFLGDAPLSVRRYQSEDPFPPEMTVGEAGLRPMDCIEVFPAVQTAQGT